MAAVNRGGDHTAVSPELVLRAVAFVVANLSTDPAMTFEAARELAAQYLFDDSDAAASATHEEEHTNGAE